MIKRKRQKQFKCKCGKRKYRYSRTCRTCYLKNVVSSRKGQIFVERKYCIDCGKELKNRRSKRCRSCNNTGINNPGHKHGKCINNKVCVDCGKPKSIMGKRCPKCSLKFNTGVFKPGKLHPNYIDGRTSVEYTEKFNKQLKSKIFKRDGYTCQLCFKYPIKCQCHHIDYNKQNNQEINLLTLCRSCHGKTNFKRDYWFSYFKNIIFPDKLFTDKELKKFHLEEDF